jgi:hypothetical protein
MWKLLDRLRLSHLVLGALLLGLSPLGGQPHLVEKLGMLLDGSLSKPLDVFDLLMHGALPLLVVVKLLRLGSVRRQVPRTPD